VSGGREYLSPSSDGSNVDLHTQDGGSGPQRWTISQGTGEWYNIKAYDGVSGGREYLSTNSDSSNVDLHTQDDGSGPQRWTIIQGTGDWYNIKAYDGVSGGREYLSAWDDGSNLDLWTQDDGSGRQRWVIPSFVLQDTTTPAAPDTSAVPPTKSAEACEAAATPDGPGKNCPDNADDSTCINGNKGYSSLKEAWDDCGQVDECGAVMLFKNGQYYLRRASDPDRPAGDGTQCFAYTCSSGKARTGVSRTAALEDTTTPAAPDTSAVPPTTSEDATTPAAPTTSAVLPTTSGETCCGKDWEDESFAQCNFWGDPHFTTVQYGDGPSANVPDIEYMNMGVFRVAASADSQYEVQSMQCSWNRKRTAAVSVAMAIKIGGSVITVINSTVYVDGTEYIEPNGEEESYEDDRRRLAQAFKLAGNLSVNDLRFGTKKRETRSPKYGSCETKNICASDPLQIQSEDCCYRASLQVRTSRWAVPHFYHRLHARIPVGSVKQETVCGVGKTYATQVGCKEMLFTPELRRKACEYCKLEGTPEGEWPPQCEDNFCGSGEHDDDEEGTPPSETDPCDGLANTGKCGPHPHDEAKMLCNCTENEEELKQCMFEYCINDCSKSEVDVICADLHSPGEKDVTLASAAPPAGTPPPEEEVSPETICANMASMGKCPPDPLAKAQELCVGIAGRPSHYDGCLKDYCSSSCETTPVIPMDDFSDERL
jgi:hypothetical protein